MRSLLFFWILILSGFSLHSEALQDENILLYRKAIQEHKFDLAESIFRKLGNDGLPIPNLELLETELWIEKGEYLYRNKQFKSAFPYFRDAYLRWRTNQLVNERYKELNSKVLTDEATLSKNESTAKLTPKLDISPLLDSINQINQNLTLIREEMKEINKENQTIVKHYTIFIYLTIFNIFLLTGLLFWNKK